MHQGRELGETLDYDLVVVGAGPAGSAAAITALDAGMSVAIVEARPFPRGAPGETLHPGAEALLRQLGVWDCISTDEAVHRHVGVWLERPGTEPRFQPYGADETGPWRGFQVRRAAFDERLLSRARALGAVVFQPARVRSVEFDGDVTLALDGRELKARWLVDSAGSGAWLARRLRIPVDRLSRPIIASWAVGRGEPPQDAPRTPNGDPVLRMTSEGWDWLAPLNGDGWSFCSVRFDGRGTCALARARDVTWRRARRSAGENWFLVGEAACVLDPVAGKGVLRALMSGAMSGWLAGRCLRGELARTRAADHYQAWLSESFQSDLDALNILYGEVGLDLRSAQAPRPSIRGRPG